MATQPILKGKIGEIGNIHRAGILKRIAVSQFRFQKIQWQ